ncbi:MAG: hypothetical protein JWO70_5147 [Betaproteobacteria bacterium]|nr:hypothetical protein [Betaproteobacteria bacterium]
MAHELKVEQIAAAQVPSAGELTLDHVAHFVPDIGAASAALERLGFTLTPFSEQSHRLEPGDPPIPAGTGNRCVMLERGYLEFLTPFAETPVADQLREAMHRYVGVHLIALGSSAPEADHQRLVTEGFDPLTPVALQRPIETAAGEETARFTVVRVPPRTMPEGRIQYCRHHTPEYLWQMRWLAHRNGARALSSVLLCVGDPEEAARRYGRFTGLVPVAAGRALRIDTARGALVFASPGTLRDTLGLTAPAVPWIAGYAIEVSDLEATRAFFAASRIEVRDLPDGRLLVALPEHTGGAIVFESAGQKPLTLDPGGKLAEAERMDALRELRDTRQVAGEPRRRWFSSADLDLIVWLDETGSVVGFQLCYDKSRGERALTWRAGRGYDHSAIDDGEGNPAQYKSTPILVADGHFDRERVAEIFLESSEDVPAPIRDAVADRLRHYS